MYSQCTLVTDKTKNRLILIVDSKINILESILRSFNSRSLTETKFLILRPQDNFVTSIKLAQVFKVYLFLCVCMCSL